MPFPLLDYATELLTDDILPLLDAHDVVSLGCCNVALHRLILSGPDAELIWKRRIRQDLRFPVESTARQQGWYPLYRKIRKPHVYLWGEAKNARLALTRSDPRINLLTRSGGIPLPSRLPFPSTPIVDLVAGGWSFHALSVYGEVYHWGQIDGMAFAPFRPASSTPSPMNAHPGSTVNVPMKLSAEIPGVRRLLSGRRHAIAVDEDGKVWTWANWAEAGLLRTDWLPNDGNTKVLDIAAGWDVSAIVTEKRSAGKEQKVHVWWQRFLAPSLRNVQNLGETVDRVEDRDGCFYFSPQSIRLPPLPFTSPSASRSGKRYSRSEHDEERIEKLAAGEHFLIALTSTGRVYKIDISVPVLGPHQQQEGEDAEDADDGAVPSRRLGELEAMYLSGRRGWEYLPLFSEPNNWTTENDINKESETEEEDNRTKGNRINFISASFKTFFAIGEGVVLQGDSETTPETAPVMMPELQNRDIIRVECGDYHYGALTSSGSLYTFGAYSNGALGHGSENSRLSLPAHLQRANHSLSLPSKVEFYDPLDNGKNKGGEGQEEEGEFVFNIAMAGWASSALTVDLREKPEGNEENVAGSSNSGPAESSETQYAPGNNVEISEVAQEEEGVGRRVPAARMGVFRPGRFRIGFPGRGMVRGRGGGGGQPDAGGHA